METQKYSRDDNAFYVLIVPCGMETLRLYFVFKSFAVLIVPCGMETAFQGSKGVH